MAHEVEVTYSEALIRKATLRFINRYIGWKFYVLLAALAGLIAHLASYDRDSWLVPAGGAVLVVAVLAIVGLYTVYYRRSISVYRQMPDKASTFTFDDDVLSFRSQVASGTIKWQLIREVWCFSDAWLLFTSKGAYMTLPVSGMTDEAKEFVVSRVKAAGGKVS